MACDNRRMETLLAFYPLSAPFGTFNLRSAPSLKCTKETNPCGKFWHLYLDKLESWLAALLAAYDC
jgi:hypothetical protein